MAFNVDESLSLLGRDPAADVDLAEIALHLSRDEYPNLDVDALLTELAVLARAVRPHLHGPLSARVQAFMSYLFHELGFQGNPGDYYDPRNSYLSDVLERRLGIPISLSVVCMAVGHRAGLRFEGVGLPGHFIVKASAAEQEILIDPFHGGRILSWDDCETLVRQATGIAFEASTEALAPAPVGVIIQRMLNNLKSIYVGREDWKRAARTMERLRQLNPYDVVLRRDLGLALVQQQQPGKALDHLRAYLGAVPEADDVEEVRRLLLAALQMLAERN